MLAQYRKRRSMKLYYIVFETSFRKYWRIRKTTNNLDTLDGLMAEIFSLEEEFNCEVVILYWKKIKNKISWFFKR
jgi:hypothetical protein